MKEFCLCPKLCFMQTSHDPCIGKEEGHCNGACEKSEAAQSYNERVLQAIASLTSRPSYVVLDKGLTDAEISCIMVVQGAFFGMGYLPQHFSNISHAAIAGYIKPYKENSYIRNLLNAVYTNEPHKVRLLEGE